MLWTAALLRETVRETLGNVRLVVVSNREPYMHVYAGGESGVRTPSLGHGERLGSSTPHLWRNMGRAWQWRSRPRLVVDAYGRIPVPHEHPCYTLKRVWLTKEEEARYYYGFANEAL